MKVLKQESMKNHTTFHAGGPAVCYVVPESREELISLIAFLYEENYNYRIIGNGSNLLVSDEGLKDVIVEVGKEIESTEIDKNRITVSSGTMMGRAALFAYENELSGMEALRGIPGTVGGAVVMNAGAYGTEIKDVLESCEVITREGKVVRKTPAELELSYRHSNIEENGEIVLSATFKLTKGKKEEILEKMKDFQQRRIDKQPLNKFSAGSTFKRPEGHFAGKLIEDAGLRGFSMGNDARVSEKHCGFVVNDGQASATQIYELIKEVEKRVKDDSGIELSPEVKLWGTF